VQKRPNRPYRIVHAPIPLPDKLPIVCSGLFRQGDAPIIWLHGHDCLELGYCREGAGLFVVGDKVLPFRTGDVSVITPAEVHLAQSVPGTTSQWTWIYLDPARLLRLVGRESECVALDTLAGRRFCNLIARDRDPMLAPIVQELITEMERGPARSETAVRGLVSVLMVHLQRLAPARRRAVSTRHTTALRRVGPALDRMAERYAEPSDVKRWARECHVSVTHFRRLFRRALGKSPHAYLTELRVQMAGSRLQATDEKVIQIAEETGFPTLSSFNRAFRRIMRQTPREWRARRL
jgi:AraC-like DNA-binding protein